MKSKDQRINELENVIYSLIKTFDYGNPDAYQIARDNAIEVISNRTDLVKPKEDNDG